MENSVHFISGLPRSGSTLLAAILRQNPDFHAGMTSPVAYFFGHLLAAMRADTEWSVLVDREQRRNILGAVFDGYYHKVYPRKIVFDTNRAWCSRMPALAQLFPQSHVIACVRNMAWIVDSFERIVRKDPFLMSRLFTPEQSRTVYSRVEHLTSPAGTLGFAWNALREAFYGEQAHRLIFVDYDALTLEPQQTMDALYDLLGQPHFTHDFDNVDYADGAEFDARLGAPGLHSIAGKVRFAQRSTILPPDIFQRFSNRCFWRGQQPNPHDVPILLPKKVNVARPAQTVPSSVQAIVRERTEALMAESGS